jgi:hypothetical protein
MMGTTDLAEVEAAYRKLISRGHEIFGSSPGIDLAKTLHTNGILPRRLI